MINNIKIFKQITHRLQSCGSYAKFIHTEGNNNVFEKVRNPNLSPQSNNLPNCFPCMTLERKAIIIVFSSWISSLKDGLWQIADKRKQENKTVLAMFVSIERSVYKTVFV